MSEEQLPPDLDVDFPMPDGLKVTTDTPYRLLVVADLAGGEGGDLDGPLLGEVVETNAEKFDALLHEARPRVTLALSDPATPKAAPVEMTFTVTSMKDFHPTALIPQAPVLGALHDAREALVARLRAQATPEQTQQQIVVAAQSHVALAWLTDALKWKPAAGGDAKKVDNLLDQLDLGDETIAEAPPQSPVAEAVAAAASAGGASQISAEEASSLRHGLAEIDKRLSGWLNAILHAPAFQRLESAWRSLQHLVSRIEFRKGVRLSVLHAPVDKLTDRFVSLLIDPVFDEGHAAPDVILIDHAFGATANEMDVLDEMAQHANSLPAVAFAAVNSQFFGQKFAWQVPSLPTLQGHFDQWQFAKYKSLRQEPYAARLGLIFGRALLRAPYADDKSADAFTFKEQCITDRDFVWLSGPVIAGERLAKSVVETRWPANIVGPADGFTMGTGGQRNDKTFGPADTELKLEKAQEMLPVGLNAVITDPRTDDVALVNGFSVAIPPRAEGLSALEVSLPYQLFATRLSNLLLLLKPHLERLSGDQLASFVLQHVRDWVAVEGQPVDEEQVSVQAKEIEDQPGSLQLAVTVTPPEAILPGAVPVVVGYRLK